MTTKTLTIVENAYNLLLENKLKSESFSKEIIRVFSKKSSRNIKDLFGILTHKEGDDMLKDLKKIRQENIKAIKKRML
ncbi:hypothetical protein HYV79_01050 [Candidatus Woesearchaeota archaeon]|nr:hypothetical protein [Candidatus Woesearchaeota archaeon]